MIELSTIDIEFTERMRMIESDMSLNEDEKEAGRILLNAIYQNMLAEFFRDGE